MRKVESKIAEVFPDFKDKLTVDGVRLSLSDGWVLIRPSGTEPVIRITAEARDYTVTDEIMQKTLVFVNRLVREAKS